MGIRPNFHLLLGIDTLQVKKWKITDPRFHATKLWDERHETLVPLPPDITLDDIQGDRTYTENMQLVRRGWLSSFLYDHNEKRAKEVSEVLEWDPEYGEPGVIGFRIAEGDYANDVYYALALVDERFQSSGHLKLPSYPLDKDISEGATYLKLALWLRKQSADSAEFMRRLRFDEPTVRLRQMIHVINRKKRLIDNGWNHIFFNEYMDGYLVAAQYLFEQIGLTIPRKDFRLMLVWQWS